MAPFLRFNVAETTRARPPRGRGEDSRSPALQNPPWWKLNAKKTQRSGSDRKPSVLETRTANPNLVESSCGSGSDTRRHPAKVGGPLSYHWKDMANKILIPLQSLVSYFLNPTHPHWANRWTAVCAIEGLWQGQLKQVGVLLSLIFFVQGSGQRKLWAQVRCLADFLAGYEGDSWACFSHCFFFLFFTFSLPGLEPGQTPQCLTSGLMKLRLLMSHCKNSVRDTGNR